jgi:hypothetical protein
MGRRAPCESGVGVIYRINRFGVAQSERHFKSISHSPASRPGRQHGWSIGVNDEVNFDSLPFVEVFEFAHTKNSSAAILSAMAERLYPHDSIADLAQTLKRCPAVTMRGVKYALERDGCPPDRIDAISNIWAEQLGNGLGLDVHLEHHFEMTDGQIAAGQRDAEIARADFLNGVGFRLVRSL